MLPVGRHKSNLWLRTIWSRLGVVAPFLHLAPVLFALIPVVHAGGDGYPWVANLDGQPAFGPEAQLRQVEKFWRRPVAADRGVRAAWSDLVPRFRIELAMARAEDRRMGLEDLVFAYRSPLEEPSILLSAPVIAELIVDPFSRSLTPQRALALVRVAGDSRRQVRVWLLEEGMQEVVELLAAAALLDAHTYGLGRLEDVNFLRLVTSRLDLAAFRLRAILTDLEIFQEDPGPGLRAPTTEAVRLAQAFVVGEREAGGAWNKWISDASKAARSFRSGTRLFALDEHQAVTLSLRRTGRRQAQAALVRMRALAPANGNFGALTGKDAVLNRRQRCYEAIRIGTVALSQDPFALEVHQLLGLALDFTQGRREAVIFLDRYLHLAGIRFYDTWTIAPGGRTPAQQDALARVLSPS